MKALVKFARFLQKAMFGGASVTFALGLFTLEGAQDFRIVFACVAFVVLFGIVSAVAYNLDPLGEF